jgi:hypothetical protein
MRAVGSDTALMQFNGIAQKLKFKDLEQKATAGNRRNYERCANFSCARG